MWCCNSWAGEDKILSAVSIPNRDYVVLQHLDAALRSFAGYRFNP